MTETPRQSNPPAWAEAVLRMVLAPEHRDSVSGDLLEDYRESVLPSRGRRRADIWYLRQTGGFLWRATWVWGVSLAAVVIARSALDWFVPPATFHARSVVTTSMAIGLFGAAGFWMSWRTRSVSAGMVAGIAMGVISAAVVVSSSLVMLALWHDPPTLWAIERSGGLSEVFTVPLLVVVPGALLATLGGVVGTGAASLFRSRAAV